MKKSIPIDLLNPTALAAIVSATMGLEVRPNMGVARIKAMMAQAGFPTDFIEYDDGKEEGELVRVEPPRARHRPGRRSVQLRIELQEKPGGAEPVFTSVNGSTFLIPRATTCWVDFKYYHALMNAVAHIAEVDEDLNITGYRKVPEYPISVFHVEPPLTAAEKAEAARIEAETVAQAAEAA